MYESESFDGRARSPLLSSISETSYESGRSGLHSGDYGSLQRQETNDDKQVKNETVPNDSSSGLKTYKRRWYILVIFSLFCMTQNFVWGQWGPISTTAEDAFGWSDSTIAWLGNWGPIAYILVGLFYPWLVQVKGLRLATLSSMAFIAVGCSLRVITSQPGAATILIHMGQFFNGLGGPITMSGITSLSCQWFSPNDRVLATSLSYVILCLGGGIGFTLGPALVTSDSSTNHTGFTTPTPINASISEIVFSYSQKDLTQNVSDARINQEREDIMIYMYYCCGWAWLITILLCVYFPSNPPSPPCISATLDRDDYWSGLWSLRKKGNFLVIALIYGLSTGVNSSWAALLNVNLKVLGISETTTGWIGFYAVIGTCVAGLLSGRFASFFNRSMKLFIFIMYLLGGACYCVLALMIEGFIGYSEAIVYVLVIGGCSFLNGAVPLIFELSCEMAYPVGESPATGFLNMLNNIAACFFLLMFSIPNIGTSWMNWAMVGSIVVCIPALGLLKTRFNRLEVDEGVHPEKYLTQSIDVTAEHDRVNGTGTVQS